MSRVDLEEAKKNIQELMRRTWVVYVATISEEGFPQVRAVENLKGTERFPHLAELFQTEEFEFATLFSTVTGFNKLKEIEANPKGSIYYCLPREWRGLMMEGTFEIVIDETTKSQIWHDDWKGFFPSGTLDPKQTIVRFTPRIVKYYNHGEHITINPTEKKASESK